MNGPHIQWLWFSLTGSPPASCRAPLALLRTPHASSFGNSRALMLPFRLACCQHCVQCFFTHILAQFSYLLLENFPQPFTLHERLCSPPSSRRRLTLSLHMPRQNSFSVNICQLTRVGKETYVCIT